MGYAANELAFVEGVPLQFETVKKMTRIRVVLPFNRPATCENICRAPVGARAFTHNVEDVEFGLLAVWLAMWTDAPNGIYGISTATRHLIPA